MKNWDKRKAVIITFSSLWVLFILSIVLPIGQRGFPTGGVSTMEVVDEIPRLEFNAFNAFLYGNQPCRGPGGTTWDWMNRTDNPLEKIKYAVKGTVQFGSQEFQARYYGPVNPNKIPVDPEKVTKQIKRMAKMLGALDARVCELDQRFVFPMDRAGMSVSYPHKYAISIIFEEELGHPFPRGDNEYVPAYYGKVAHGYFLMDYVSAQIAEFTRSLGYPATAHSNGNVHSVALAVKAGHGELGRLGQLITRNWGPNVRIATVTTDIPLIIDQPVDIGIQHFCENCKLCSEYCPGSAIPFEKSITRGVKKFAVNYQRCRRATVAGTDIDVLPNTCSICRDVCPWAKEGKYWLHRFGRFIASRSWVARKLLLEIDYILYSRDNRYGMKQVVDDMRTRIKKSWEVMPDTSELWMTVGSRSDEQGRQARMKYLEMYPMYWDFMSPDRPLIFPYKGTDNPNFNKIPEWTDPWGRVVKGGEHGSTALDPNVDIFQGDGGSTFTAGGGPTIIPPMIMQPPKGRFEAALTKGTLYPVVDYPN